MSSASTIVKKDENHIKSNTLIDSELDLKKGKNKCVLKRPHNNMNLKMKKKEDKKDISNYNQTKDHIVNTQADNGHSINHTFNDWINGVSIKAKFNKTNYKEMDINGEHQKSMEITNHSLASTGFNNTNLSCSGNNLDSLIQEMSKIESFVDVNESKIHPSNNSLIPKAIFLDRNQKYSSFNEIDVNDTINPNKDGLVENKQNINEMIIANSIDSGLIEKNVISLCDNTNKDGNYSSVIKLDCNDIRKDKISESLENKNIADSNLISYICPKIKNEKSVIDQANKISEHLSCLIDDINTIGNYDDHETMNLSNFLIEKNNIFSQIYNKLDLLINKFTLSIKESCKLMNNRNISQMIEK